MIFDTDILSMLGKIGKTDLLRKLFPKTSLVISFEVYNELLRAKEAGYDFVDDVLDKREIENVIKDIEEKDRTRITRKEEIFADVM